MDGTDPRPNARSGGASDSGGSWGEAEEIISNYAAEPCVDYQGNIYFVHHFMTPGEHRIEADIYVCRKP